MKKGISLMLICMLALTAIPSRTIQAYTERASLNQNITHYEEANCQALIENIELRLNQMGSSIERELYEFEDRLYTESIRQGYLITSEEIRLNKIQKGDLTNEFVKSAVVNVPDPRATYNMAVLAIIAWFGSQGYDLAAELLAHARDNKTPNSVYRPVFGGRVEDSAVYQMCRNDYSKSRGSGEFNPGSTTNDMDLYYAIHGFTWYRLSSGLMRIDDRYDFAIDKNWLSIEGIAVNTMVAAQAMGVITPYIVRIEL